MSTLLASQAPSGSADDVLAQARLEARLPPLLSVIAGMVDLTGFFMLGHVFTAHVTGNLVVAAAAVVEGGPLLTTQMIAIPVFMLALAAVWWIAHVSDRRGPDLARLLLLVQLVLLVAVLIFSVIARPSTHPHGIAAGVIALLCVCAMACQYALLRLAMPKTVSTSVMTGNLTNTVLALMDASSTRRLLPPDADRLRRSLYLLGGFLLGCVVAAMAVSAFKDWAWTLPVVLAAGALAVR